MSDTSFIDQYGDVQGEINITVTNQIVIKDIKKVIRDHPTRKSLRIDLKNFPASLKCQHTLIVYPSGSGIHRNVYEGQVLMLLESKNSQDITIEAKYGIINKEGTVVNMISSREYDSMNDNCITLGKDFISHDKLFAAENGFLQEDGNLILSVELKIRSKTVKTSRVDYPKSFMVDMYESLFEDADRFDADFVIECSDQKEVRCHRNILSAAFSYFEVDFILLNKSVAVIRSIKIF